MNYIKNFNSDLFDSFKRKKIWLILSWLDIYKRYRRSYLGQIWIVLSTLILTLSISFIYSSVFKMDFSFYCVYITMNFTLWFYLRDSIVESCTCFIENKTLLFNQKWNHLVFVLRVVCKNFLIFLHNFILILLLNFVFNKELNFFYFLIFFFNLIFLVTPILFNLCLIAAILCTRFRDMTLIITNILQIVFFITPILFTKNFLVNHPWVMDYNIFAISLKFVNDPIIYGVLPELNLYLKIIFVFIILFFINSILYSLKKNRLNYWL